MPNITLTNGRILDTLVGLQSVTPSTALGAVKLGRLRKALLAEAEPIIAAFDEAGQRHAKKDEGGKPVVRLDDDTKEPLAWKVTGTPFYDLEDAAAFTADTQAMYAESITVDIAVRLQEKDLEHMTVSSDVGELLLPFVHGL